ncbi:hypothetical protein GCM10009425_28120 [Pseudomonas asuensis]|uniref:Uncharacterized protein n=1 Tax=Pseudomonas asuensis TaxID=1825787 RepID=A0ABQ2GXD9_9PSED|nr:hypothetical protein GCM10009425_28120 [Pseudomonas asuensis]
MIIFVLAGRVELLQVIKGWVVEIHDHVPLETGSEKARDETANTSLTVEPARWVE